MYNEIRPIRCPYCGAHDKIIKNNDIYKCSYCDCEFYIPNDKNEKILEEAHDYLIRYKFDDADDLYRGLIREANDNNDDELYVMAEWGRLLAYFGVVYIKGFDSNVSIPTFAKYDNRFDSVTKSEHFQNILESNISKTIKDKYIRMANKLDNTYSRIGIELRKTPNYDVFLCVKISLKTTKYPDLEGYTRDSKLADSIYYELTNRGYKVFYSDKCCQGIEYDSQILSALSRSKSLLVISTSKQFLESPWVQSEWRRWLNFIQWDEKPKDSLFLYLPNYSSGFELPVILTKKKIQYFDNSLDTINHLIKMLNEKTNNVEVIKNKEKIVVSDNIEEVKVENDKINKIHDNPKAFAKNSTYNEWMKHIKSEQNISNTLNKENKQLKTNEIKIKPSNNVDSINIKTNELNDDWSFHIKRENHINDLEDEILDNSLSFSDRKRKMNEYLSLEKEKINSDFYSESNKKEIKTEIEELEKNLKNNNDFNDLTNRFNNFINFINKLDSKERKNSKFLTVCLVLMILIFISMASPVLLVFIFLIFFVTIISISISKNK